jgi:hypothetical protein
VSGIRPALRLLGEDRRYLARPDDAQRGPLRLDDAGERTPSAAAIAHSVSTLGVALPDSSWARVDLPSPDAAPSSASAMGTRGRPPLLRFAHYGVVEETSDSVRLIPGRDPCRFQRFPGDDAALYAPHAAPTHTAGAA